MTENAQQQLHSIHAMLAAGQRSVHLERHSLLLFGGGGGMLCLLTEYVITADRFPDFTQRGVMLAIWLSLWLGSISLLDHWLTRRVRALRAETLPFAQAQITRAWWMLLTVGILGSFAMFFFGGGVMIYALWIVLLGLGMYLFGLFSRPLIEWIGLATIMFGVLSLGSGMSYGETHWLAASCFLIGMPLAGWLPHKVDDRKLLPRVIALTIWMMLVLAPVILLSRIASTASPIAQAIAADAPDAGIGAKVIRLEAGTHVPMHIDMQSPIVNISPQAAMNITLNMPIEVSLVDGVPDGRYRIGDSDWHDVREGLLQLHIDKVMPHLENGMPSIQMHSTLTRTEMKGGQR